MRGSGGLDRMDATESGILLQITDKLLANKLNAEFSYPIPVETLPGYAEKITKPMDLGTIHDKLRRNQYENSVDWYEDVRLVYENCKNYYGEGTIWGILARYNQQQFERLAVGYNHGTLEAWYERARQQFDKIIKLAANGPVPQGLDPLLDYIVRNVERQIPLKPKEIADTIETMNGWVENPNRMREVEYLLKKFQPGLSLEGDTEPIVVDAEQLNEVALKALCMYVKAHSA